MKRLMSVILLVLVAVGIFASTSKARLSNNNRRAVVLECFYALRPSADGSCDKTIDGNCVSNWGYLGNDWNAYSAVKSWYGSDSSTWSLFYSDVYSYGYGTFNGYYGPVGRGGQCKYFSDLILYRSESSARLYPDYNHTLPSYSDMSMNVETDLTKAIQGDVIFSTSVPHVAIVVELKSNGLDVIDSNFISDIQGTGNREVIGRHLILWSNLNAYGYKIYKGVSYYYEPYVP